MEKHDVLSQCYGHLVPPVDLLTNIHKVTFKDKHFFLFSRKQKVVSIHQKLPRPRVKVACELRNFPFCRRHIST